MTLWASAAGARGVTLQTAMHAAFPDPDISVPPREDPASDIRILDGLHHKSLREILAGVKNLKEGKIGAILRKFSGADSSWVWKVTEASLSRHVNAVTDYFPGGAVTRLNYNALKGATKLSVARTLIHELVHAYLILYFKHEPLEAINEYPRIVAAYRGISPAPALNDVHHHEMSIAFVEEIAIALREYGRSIGLEADDVVYRDLAWGGLDFEKDRKLAEGCKQRIFHRLNAEQYGTQVYSVYPVAPQIGR